MQKMYFYIKDWMPVVAYRRRETSRAAAPQSDGVETASSSRGPISTATVKPQSALIRPDDAPQGASNLSLQSASSYLFPPLPAWVRKALFL